MHLFCNIWLARVVLESVNVSCTTHHPARQWFYQGSIPSVIIYLKTLMYRSKFALVAKCIHLSPAADARIVKMLRGGGRSDAGLSRDWQCSPQNTPLKTTRAHTRTWSHTIGRLIGKVEENTMTPVELCAFLAVSQRTGWYMHSDIVIDNGTNALRRNTRFSR